ncbi:MAG TPA: hypothetical protein VFP35_02940 [Candidatus Saccharimonadales bacterium]|nr:hypothetical protein [Candidatus Saccharimonadales bacterium]
MEQLRENAGLPGLLAGAGALIAGNFITQFTEDMPQSNLHEVIGDGVSALTALVVVGLVGAVRLRRQNLSVPLAESIDSADSNQRDC